MDRLASASAALHALHLTAGDLLLSVSAALAGAVAAFVAAAWAFGPRGHRVRSAQPQTDRSNRATEERTVATAWRDPETDLPNFSALKRHIGASAEGALPQRYIALFCVERFKAIRSRVGHEGAAELIGAIGRKIIDARSEGLVARLDSDLVGVCFVAGSPEDALASLEKLQMLIDTRFSLAGQSIDITTTAGLAGPLAPDASPDVAVEGARVALERAQDSKRRAAVFLGSEYELVVDRLSLMHDLRAGLKAGELFLCYQPKFRARTNEFASAEALIRWRHPRLGLISPAEFIPMAEETGDIRAVTDWVLAQAVADQKRLAQSGFETTIHVNISACLISDRQFTHAALQLIESRCAPIGFEITETAVIEDPEAALANLNLLAEGGVRIAIDDYGSGMSSLAYLKRLPADELKIDRMFVSTLTQSHRDPLLVRSTIDLAHGLGMEVTAEGVETPSALALLRVMGCDMVQGYLMARPMPLQDLVDFLGDERRLGHLPPETRTVIRPASYW